MGRVSVAHQNRNTIAFLRQVRYIFRTETITGQGLGVPHQSRKRYIPLLSLSEIQSKKKAKLSIRKKRLKLIHGMN